MWLFGIKHSPLKEIYVDTSVRDGRCHQNSGNEGRCLSRGWCHAQSKILHNVYPSSHTPLLIQGSIHSYSCLHANLLPIHTCTQHLLTYWYKDVHFALIHTFLPFLLPSSSAPLISSPPNCSLVCVLKLYWDFCAFIFWGEGFGRRRCPIFYSPLHTPFCGP